MCEYEECLLENYREITYSGLDHNQPTTLLVKYPLQEMNAILCYCYKRNNSNRQCRCQVANAGKLHERPTVYHVAIKLTVCCF